MPGAGAGKKPAWRSPSRPIEHCLKGKFADNLRMGQARYTSPELQNQPGNGAGASGEQVFCGLLHAHEWPALIVLEPALADSTSSETEP